jgi:hypothetical protein
MIWVSLESTNSTADCFEDTAYRYGKFDIFLYGPSSTNPHPNASG